MLRTHRRCAPEHAGLVRQLCTSDRSVLPRWHQDDRGQRDAHRGVHVMAPEGAYSQIPVWRSREHWLTWVVPAAIRLHRDVLARHHVDPDTFRAWAAVKSGYAQAGGRRCVVRPDTLASVLQVSERTVQRCTAAAREMGLEVVVLAGRMLNLDECTTARRRGSRQRGLSTEVALTFPQVMAQIVDHGTPTRGRSHRRLISPSEGVPDGLAADQTEAAPPRHQKRGRRTARPRPAGWDLACQVARSVPWLAAEHPARLAPALTRFATCRLPWEAADVAAALHEHTVRLGGGAITSQTIRTRPAALLAAILRRLDPDIDNPALYEPSAPNQTPDQTAPTQPCTQAGCDHGWITRTRADGHPGLAPCPTCPPSARRSRRPTDLDDPLDDIHDPLNPLF